MRDFIKKYDHIAYWIILVIAALAQWRNIDYSHDALLIIGSIVFLFGIPHGAADTLIFRHIQKNQDWSSWLIFSFVYTAMASAVYFIWLWSPGIFLTYLLFISLIHFGDDLYDLPDHWIRLSYGCSMVFSPALMWQDEVSRLYGFLVETSSALTFAYFSHLFSLASILCLAAATFAYSRNHKKKLAFTLFWPIITLVILQPIIGFALYFSLWHSRLHLKRLVDLRILKKEIITMLFIATPLLITLAGVYYSFYILGGINDNSFSKVMFVGLGALTFPHFFMVYALGGIKRELNSTQT